MILALKAARNALVRKGRQHLKSRLTHVTWIALLVCSKVVVNAQVMARFES